MQDMPSVRHSWQLGSWQVCVTSTAPRTLLVALLAPELMVLFTPWTVMATHELLMRTKSLPQEWQVRLSVSQRRQFGSWHVFERLRAFRTLLLTLPAPELIVLTTPARSVGIHVWLMDT
jgi:adenosyl cobinamide kinase/adenosyl cobinamide phosphate guanylyltransferase